MNDILTFYKIALSTYPMLTYSLIVINLSVVVFLIVDWIKKRK